MLILGIQLGIPSMNMGRASWNSGAGFNGNFDEDYTPEGYSITNNQITNNRAGDMVWVFGVITDKLPTEGQWYCEVVLSGNADNLYLGLVDARNLADATNTATSTGLFNNGIGWWENGGVNIDGSSSGVADSIDFSESGGEVLQFAWDADTETLQVGLNGTFSSSTFNRAFPEGAHIAVNCRKDTASAIVYTAAADQTYSPPTGYSPLS